MDAFGKFERSATDILAALARLRRKWMVYLASEPRAAFAPRELARGYYLSPRRGSRTVVKRMENKIAEGCGLAYFQPSCASSSIG
jgi:hypothetical protein